jgi:hypothetical protein
MKELTKDGIALECYRLKVVEHWDELFPDTFKFEDVPMVRRREKSHTRYVFVTIVYLIVYTMLRLMMLRFLFV